MSLLNVARQHLRTCQLLGVDFVPRGRSVEAATHVEVKPVEVEPEIVSSALETESAPMVDTRTDKAAALAELKARHDAECPHCTTATGHTQTVFGEGDPDAQLMFIGEAPGAEEDRTGRPFVGRAGQKLDEIIAAMGLKREGVFIANILKSRPPDNRTPLQPEVEACAPYLAEQIAIIEPKVIVALGGPSTKFLLDTTVGITRLRGQWATYSNVAMGLSVPVMPTFHPAYLLRNYTPDTRRKMWSDMQAVIDRLGE